MTDWKYSLAEHFPLLVGAVGHATDFTKAAFIPVASAILTSVVMSGMTADKVAARLEERIASRPDGTFGVLLAESFIHHYAGCEV